MAHPGGITMMVVSVVVLFGCSGGGSGNGGSGGSGSVFLIAGNNGDQWYGSTPGDWTEVLGISSAYDGRGVAFGNGRYLWTGDCGVGCSGLSNAASSSSLSDDDFDTADFGGLATVYQAAFGNGVFVAIGENQGQARSWVSADARNWTTHIIAGFSIAFNITFGGGRFVIDCTPSAAPFDDQVCHSSDGMNWTGVALTDAFDVSEVGYGNAMFLAVRRRQRSQPARR